MKLNDRPVEHRARCKFCGTPPMYYTTTYGFFYHIPAISRTVGSSNRFKTDWSRRKIRDKKEYPEAKIMRWNSMRGTVVTTSQYFRKHKDNFGGYGILLSCKCAETTWMFNISFDQDILNRQIVVFFDDKYPKRRYLEDVNIATF
jgi:hypothetical protein